MAEEALLDELTNAMFDAKDVSVLLKMPRSTVYQRAKDDELPFPAVYIGKSLRFRRAEVLAFVKGELSESVPA